MTLFIEIQQFWGNIFYFILSIQFLLILSIFFILYHIIVFFIRDKKYLDNLKKYNDSEIESIDQLTDKPLINFVIPAWKEGKTLEESLLAIKNLSYPKIRVILNAGGNEETIKIANSFKHDQNFVILQQEQGGGKIKALNDALEYINDGLIWFIDADVLITLKTLFKMLFPILFNNEQIVVGDLKPTKALMKKDLVKYIYINRNRKFRRKFSRYLRNELSQCVCFKFDVIKSIKRFSEKQLFGDGKSMAFDLIEKDFKVYQLLYPVAESYNFPTKILKYLRQNIRWLENGLFFRSKTKNRKVYIKFSLLILYSLYLVIFPFLIFFNLYLFLLGLCLLEYSYLKNIRKVIFFKLSASVEETDTFNISFYIKIIGYIYAEILMNIYVAFELIIFGKKKYKKRKNIF